MVRGSGGGRRERADVAVYAPYAGALYTTPPKPTGGAEMQSLYLTQALARAGLKVRHVVLSAGPLPRERDGVGIVGLPSAYGSRGLARRKAVVAALHAADASVYIQRCAGFETGVVGAFARLRRRRSIFSSSSVADFDLTSETARIAGASLDHVPTRIQYLLGLRLVDAIVVQTEEQQQRARSRGLSTSMIRSFCVVPELVYTRREFFLWVGNPRAVKDPGAYVELARRVPEARFLMVAGDPVSTGRSQAAELKLAAANVPNLDVLLDLARDDVLALYPRSVAIVNTSWVEGFPNTFLEAWARGTPALSLRVDPDRLIERNGLGFACGGSMERLEERAKALWARRDELDPEPLRSYVRRVHDPDVVARHWLELLSELLPRRRT
jgi:glycosyltransferase involved in cell wall biosynthesis